MHKIAILASGAGSNARNIIQYFSGSKEVQVALIASNKAQAGVMDIAREHGIPTFILNKENFLQSDVFLNELKNLGVDYVILAGFLWKVPANLVKAYEGKILNIHPALLPKYGGKGMYGHHVHEAVHAAREKESGITIHLVNEHYDEGDIYFQVSTAIEEYDTPADIERKVRELEIAYYPDVISKFISETSAK
ncbi:MAG TPA: phosphoribosylglycinamide formyltransferase [Flavobacteriales bacterium]